MLPVLLDLGFLKIYTFGVFLVLAFFWSSFLLWKYIRLTSYKEEDIFDSLFFCLAGATFFGRLVYVLFNFDKFGFSILRFILINGYPGISAYGFFIGAFISLWLYLNFKKIKFSELVDYFVPPLMLAIAIGKLGSFFSGNEVGAQTKFFLAVKYANMAGFRHIVALYESMFFFLGAYLAYRLLFKIRRGQFKKGFGMYFFWWYFALVYFIFDPLKSSHIAFLGQSFNQIASICLLLTVSLYFVYHYKALIFKQIHRFINYTVLHGYKTISSISGSTRKKTKRNEDGNEKSD